MAMAMVLPISTRFSRLLLKKAINIKCNKNLWAFVAIAFNRVDADRLKLVGPDRLCAEWMLKNGGAVRFVSSPDILVNNYNVLPPENVRLRIKEIDASDSSIMSIGLDHLKNCTKIDTAILHNCKHLEEGSLEGLRHIESTLKKLQVSGCYNFGGQCLLAIKELKGLEQLKIFDMPYVKNMEAVASELQKALPKCTMDITK